MIKKKNRVLIGSITENDFNPITTIARAFITSKILNEKYEFITHHAYRKYGKAHTAKFNLINILYFLMHFVDWCIKIIIYRPDIAHYPVTSFWNLEKSLFFLKIAGIFGAKKVGQLHGGAFVDFWNKMGKVRKKINLNEINKLDILLVASNYWKRMLQDRCGIKTRIEILYNPINESFKTTELKFNERHCDNILYMGRISINKGVLDIIESANLVLNNLECRFLLAGIILKEDDLNKCKDLIKKYKLDKKVFIIGQVTEKEKIKLFEESSIFLFPSYCENFPLVIIEAAAAGLATITTPVGALPEFFEHNKSVIFVEPGNVEQVSEAILELINDAEKRRLLGKAAREVFIKKLGRKRILESLDNIYQEVLKNI